MTHPTNETLTRDREEILEHIHGIFRAYLRRDREAIRRGHTKDWCGFVVRSHAMIHGIEEYMKSAEEALAAFSGIRYEILESEIQIHGDIAVVFYLARYWVRVEGDRTAAEDREHEDGEHPVDLRSVDIYRRDPGGWNQTGSNICVVPAV